MKDFDLGEGRHSLYLVAGRHPVWDRNGLIRVGGADFEAALGWTGNLGSSGGLMAMVLLITVIRASHRTAIQRRHSEAPTTRIQ
jgi:hypothetical protein